MGLFVKKRHSTSPKTPYKGINAYVLLFIVLLVSTCLTYIIPAGSYERVQINDKTIIKPATFEYTSSTPVGLIDFASSLHKGMVKSAEIIFFVFVVGGVFGILSETKALQAFIFHIAKRWKDKEKLLIPMFTLFFAAAGSLMGMAEETLIYIGILVPMSLALGFDVITGTAIVLLGASVGFTAAIMNPFTVGIAQGIAELPTFSGMWLRLLLLVAMYLAAVIYIYRYALKIKKNPTLGFYGLHKEHSLNEVKSNLLLERHHKIILSVFVVNYAILVYGVSKHGWYIQEISGLFLLFGIVSGMIGKLSPSKIADSFVEGAKNLIEGALIIGLAQAILVIFQSGQIMDTILYFLSNILMEVPPVLSAIGMFVMEVFLDFLIPSGSGKAALTMPIMIPLADMVGVTRQTTVLAYQLGDGISNLVFPTVGYLMAGLSLAGIPWTKWLKWVFPFIFIQVIIGLVALIIAQSIGYGPF